MQVLPSHIGRGVRLVLGAALAATMVAACSSSSGSSPSATTATPDTRPVVAEGDRGIVEVRMVTVGDPGNSSVGVVSVFGGQNQFVAPPANGGIYPNCGEAPPGPPECLTVGGVAYQYDIGELEITVDQYVTFLNTVDPTGQNPHQLYLDYMNPQVWPKYGSIALSTDAARGRHYSVAYPEWADKPFGFADFLRSARFANSLTNGDILSQGTSTSDGFQITTYEVRLSPETEHGMYDMSTPDTTRSAQSGFVVPSNDEWTKAAYYDPKGGGTLGYWQYPTGPTDAPNPTRLDPSTGDVVNTSDQPLATYSPQGPRAPDGAPYPTWCPPQAGQEACDSQSPTFLPPGLDPKVFQGNLSTTGSAGTRSPWGTLDQGGNVVEWQDTLVDAPPGYTEHRVWRRMHGGVANAPSYQMLISAFGFQPQDQVLLDGAYPWFGLRIGYIQAS